MQEALADNTELDTVLEDDAEDEAERGPALSELILRAQEEQAEIIAENNMFQNQVQAILDARQKGRGTKRREQQRSHEMEARYR